MSNNGLTLGHVLNSVIKNAVTGLHVAMPAEVVSYDASSQTVDLQVKVNDRLEREDGTVEFLPVPVLVGVPVAFPSGGSFRITFPIQKGDTGAVIWADRSIQEWQATGTLSSPPDVRSHHLADALLFIPGVHPDNRPWSGADTSAITLGSDSGAADWVALASKVNARLDALESAMNSHVHLTAGTGAPSPAVNPAGSTPYSLDGESVASATVKVKG